MRLVDPTQLFQTVYSLYHHEYLGHLISAHYIELLSNEELSLVHQGAYPDNLKPFLHGMDEKDKEMIASLNEITPRSIIKKFGGNPREPLEFFTSKYQGTTKELIHTFIQRRMAKILPMLYDRPLFTMGNDGYPAHTPVYMPEAQATIIFHFRRKPEFTRYYPTIKLEEEQMEIMGRNVAIICEEPAWVLQGERLFTFKHDIEGKKLKPFLRQKFILIQKDKEPEYYKKFITSVVEKYKVKAKGFEIRELEAQPVFSLQVSDHNTSMSFKPMVTYEGFQFPLEPLGRNKVMLEQEGDEYTFYRIHREEDKEQRALAKLEKIKPNPTHITPWEYLPKEDGLRWLSDHTDDLRAAAIQIVQPDSANRINLDRPEIHLVTTDAGDWFDIEAIVQIGDFKIPFIRFRQNILRGKREFILPDNSIAILPDSWFTDFRHLLEISEPKDDETFSIRKYQAPLLNFPSRGGLDDFADTLKNLESVPEYPLPVGLKAELRQYQVQGYHWMQFMKANGMGAILADDMGLGKTLQTITLLLMEKEEGATSPSLVVMPTSLIHNWRNEIKRFAPDLRVLIHTGVNRAKNAGAYVNYDLILTTYGIVRQDRDMLQAFPFNYIILDESQSIKNPESKTAKSVKGLVCKHRLSLTGTPIENTVMDIWSQMSFLNPGLLGSEHFFKKFYVFPIEKENDLQRSAKLRRIIYPFLLRRKKNQVEKELPPRIEKLQYCEMEDGQREFYDETRSQYRNYLMKLISEGSLRNNKLNILAGLQKLRQIAIHPQLIDKEKFTLSQSGKYQEVKRLLYQVIENGSKVLIFSQFVKMLHLLRDDLISEGIRFNYLDGATRDRQDQVDTFQQSADIPVFLISLKAGGVGLNLTAADYVFILDPWWNPAVENQAVDRSHRIGQQKPVFFYKFITEESIEEKILKLQRKKSQLSDDIITVEEDIYSSLNEKELTDLLG